MVAKTLPKKPDNASASFLASPLRAFAGLFIHFFSQATSSIKGDDQETAKPTLSPNLPLIVSKTIKISIEKAVSIVILIQNKVRNFSAKDASLSITLSMSCLILETCVCNYFRSRKIV